MSYPKYIDSIAPIRLQDPLSNFLGLFEEGIIEFSYLDIVKSAGHSCPTVLGAYLSCQEGLNVLYGESLPVRGEVAVAFEASSTEGVSGVISNVITQITGATENSGFKGVNGNFSRVGLMSFSENIGADVRFTRLDTKRSVRVTYSLTSIPTDLRQTKLMSKILQNSSTKAEEALFHEIWHQRVETILRRRGEVIKIQS